MTYFKSKLLELRKMNYLVIKDQDRHIKDFYYFDIEGYTVSALGVT